MPTGMFPPARGAGLLVPQKYAVFAAEVLGIACGVRKQPNRSAVTLGMNVHDAELLLLCGVGLWQFAMSDFERALGLGKRDPELRAERVFVRYIVAEERDRSTLWRKHCTRNGLPLRDSIGEGDRSFGVIASDDELDACEDR
jgi:hypothetical protein